MNLNKLILAGHLTKDPEIQYTQSGSAMLKFNIVIKDKYKSGDTWKEQDIFVDNITVWGKLAETLNEYLHKGMEVLIDGKLTSNIYKDKNYINITANSVQFHKSAKDIPCKENNSNDNIPCKENNSNDNIPF